jgi:hypothetical protein
MKMDPTEPSFLVICKIVLLLTIPFMTFRPA